MLQKVLQKLREIKRRLCKYAALKVILPSVYKKHVKLPVNEKKIIFFENRLPEVSNSFKLLYDHIVQRYDVEVNVHFLREGFVTGKENLRRNKELIKDLATARYVFTNEASYVLGCVCLRPETVVTQTWHGCGAFKKFGFSTAELIFGGSRKELTTFPIYRNYDHVTISSPEVKWAYEEAMNLKNRRDVVKPIGVSRTDVFYDELFIAEARRKLQVYMPESVGKKVILYAPTFRGRVAQAAAPDMLRIEMFKERLAQEYVLLIKQHPLVKIRPEVPASCLDFARDFTFDLTIEELLCVADICISDYSSLVYEYSLFTKPMIFFSYDLQEYFNWRGFYYPYDELTPGPVFTTNEEMLDYIENIREQFEPEKVARFRDKFMRSCDGHATERIVKLVFEENLKPYQREVPLTESLYELVQSEKFFEEYQREKR